MFDKMLDLFMKFRFSEWWYILIAVFLCILYSFLTKAKKGSNAKYENVQRVILILLGISLFIIILLIVSLYVYTGFYSNGMADNIEMRIIIVLAISLLLIPLVCKMAYKKKRGCQCL